MTPMDKLRKKAAAFGDMKSAAQNLGISATYLADVLDRRRGVSVRFASIVNDRFGVDGLALMKWQAAEDWKRHREKLL